MPLPSSDVPSLHLRDARLPDGSRGTVVVRDGVIAQREGDPPDAIPEEGPPRTLDLDGALLLPAPVDTHLHLDKTFFGGPWPSHEPEADSVRGRVAYERRRRHATDRPVRTRAEALLRHLIAQGTTALRTHADVDDDVELSHVEALLDLREAYADRVDMEVVAFPQSGVTACPGAADLLDAAMDAGADLVGGLDPQSFSPGEAAEQMDVVFDLAERHDAGIDIHLHDAGRAGNAQLREIAARTAARGLEGRVAVSHAFSLGDPAAQIDFAATAEALARADVHIITSVPGRSHVPPVKPLRKAGVTVAAGSDNIRDAWSPLGTGDMLERALFLARRQGYRRDADLRLAYDVCSTGGAAVMGRPERRLEPGAPADLVAVDAETVGDALARRPERRCVIHEGRIVA